MTRYEKLKIKSAAIRNRNADATIFAALGGMSRTSLSSNGHITPIAIVISTPHKTDISRQTYPNRLKLL